MRTTTPRVEHRRDGFGLGTSVPRLSWTVEGGTGTQARADVEVVRHGRRETAVVHGPDQVLVDWPFAPLASREQVAVRVRVTADDGTVARWSDFLTIEAALLDRADWRVPLIVPSPSAMRGVGPRPAHLLRAQFTVERTPVRARLYATAQGVYRAELNGAKVGDQDLAPGWTSYDHRLRTQTYDVTPLLRSGDNALGVEIADGWFRGRIGFDGGVWDLYGSHLGLVAQLELTDTDGAVRIVDLDWRTTADGPTVATALYEGETYDARRHDPAWSLAGFDDTTWRRPEIRPLGSVTARLEPAVGDPVRQVERLAPVAVERRANGRIRLDFGQNVSGRVEIRVCGAAGATVRLHHAEVLENDELGTRPLRTATSTDTYVLRGEPGGEVYQPRFTVHGFRYVELEGWPGTFQRSDVHAVVVHTDMARTGWFAASDPLLEKLHENTVWSMRDNFVDLPTDCPQRDERLGWTGDIQVFAPAATYLYRSGGVLDSWLRDVADEQGPGGSVEGAPDGAVPNFVPWVPCGFPSDSTAAWGDAAVVVPWTMYERYGDAGILAQQFDSMSGWVDHLASRADDDGVVRSGFGLGDWLDPAAPPDDPGAGRTDKHLVTTAYIVRSARLLVQAAEVLGRDDVAARYRKVGERSAAGFRTAYVLPDGRLAHESVTGYALVIAFGLLADDGQRQVAGRRLAELVRDGDHRIQTGFVGTPIVCDALADTGQMDTAYRLLLERACPSWLYPVTMDATTIWERWDSMLPDGRVNPGDMTSFNHYALGAVVDFLHRVVAGLAPAAPGYRRVRVAPRVGGGLTSASARLDSPYGRIEAGWTRRGDEVEVLVEVPFGVRADVVLPDGATHEVGAGRHVWTAAVIEDVPTVEEVR
ncbi:family 78 glycoside hydrolase catalytic domain [Isoptericola sp. NPDC057191]|uniref:alpha-L-rhamnosidase n=1 Tax=Isoptericola sp. NPDC057191 TaxID=3346041 RepID=UPI0036432086